MIGRTPAVAKRAAALMDESAMMACPRRCGMIRSFMKPRAFRQSLRYVRFLAGKSQSIGGKKAENQSKGQKIAGNVTRLPLQSFLPPSKIISFSRVYYLLANFIRPFVFLNA